MRSHIRLRDTYLVHYLGNLYIGLKAVMIGDCFPSSDRVHISAAPGPRQVGMVGYHVYWSMTRV